MTRNPPRLACFLVRDQIVLGDLVEEYNSCERSKVWFWKQVLSLLWLVRPTERQESTRPGNLFSDFCADLRYGARSISKNPGFAGVVILAIALGVSVNTAVFSMFNALVLRPLPVPDAHRVIGVHQTFQGEVSRNVNGGISLFSYPEYQSYRDENRVFSGLAAYYPQFRATLASERPRDMSGELATCNYFSTLGIRPAIGRTFTESDCNAGGTPVVVLSDSAWRNVFGGAIDILGKPITLNRTILTVIGVATPGFHGAQYSASEFWVPLSLDPLIHPGESLRQDNLSWLDVVGRLKTGATLDQARANLSVIAAQIDHRHPGRMTTLSVDMATLLNAPEERRIFLGVAALIFAAVSLVLLIACANVANLLLSRASVRQKEIAVRLSVGASRGRLFRQLLTESVLLAVPGGLAGGLAASLCMTPLFLVFVSALPGDAPPVWLNLGPDIRVLAYTISVTLVTGIIFGLVPALQATRSDLTAALKADSSGSGTSGSRGRLRNVLVAAQVSICLLLLIAAGLLARGLQASQHIQPGFRTDHVVAVKFDLEQEHYDQRSAAEFHRALAKRVASLPGVDGVADAAVVPLSMESWGGDIKLPGRPNGIPDRYNLVSPEFFSVLKIPIIHGRNFTAEETKGNRKVAIVMQSTARKLWPGQDPVGKTFTTGEPATSTEVVGVVRDVHSGSLSELDPVFFYFPLSSDQQLPLKLLLHSNASFEQTVALVRASAKTIDPNILADVRSMDQNLRMYRTPGRIVTGLASVLGTFALFLATIGIYSVVSFAVSRRIREIGIRMTLGAGRRELLRLILSGAMRPVMAGLGLGIAAAGAVSHVLTSVLYGISPIDPIAFIGVTLFFVGVALLASFIPARRAIRVDPMVALRYE